MNTSRRKRLTVLLAGFLIVLLFLALPKMTEFTAEESSRSISNHLMKMELQPWKDDAACSKFRIRFIENQSYPLMALASHPGSGNTWTRQIIERMTGSFSGSLYGDWSIFNKGLLGELMPASCGCTIVQKTHQVYPEKDDRTTNFDGSGILILRNPYKAFLSFRNFLPGVNDHVHLMPHSHFEGPDWENYIDLSVPLWVDLALIWIESIRKGGVLHYENLVADRRNQIRKLMKMLNVQVDEQRLDCVLKHDPKQFKRDNSISFDPFTVAQKQVIDQAIITVQRALKRHRLEPMPLDVFQYFNQSAYQASDV